MAETKNLNKFDSLLLFAAGIFAAGIMLIVFGTFMNNSDVSTMGYGLCTSITGFYFGSKFVSNNNQKRE